MGGTGCPAGGPFGSQEPGITMKVLALIFAEVRSGWVSYWKLKAATKDLRWGDVLAEIREAKDLGYIIEKLGPHGGSASRSWKLTREAAGRERNKVSLKARRIYCKENGLCIQCRTRKVVRGGRCESCLASRAAYMKKYIKRQREAAAAVNVCQVCLKREAMPRRTRCGYCSETNAESTRNYHRRKRAAARGVDLSQGTGLKAEGCDREASESR